MSTSRGARGKPYKGQTSLQLHNCKSRELTMWAIYNQLANIFTPRVSRNGEPYRLQGELIMRLFYQLISCFKELHCLPFPSFSLRCCRLNFPRLLVASSSSLVYGSTSMMTNPFFVNGYHSIGSPSQEFGSPYVGFGWKVVLFHDRCPSDLDLCDRFEEK